MTDPTSVEIVLLPCPFCGCAPEFEPHEDHEGHFAEASIWCEGDNCIGPQTTAAYFSDAAKQWNTRSAASIIEALSAEKAGDEPGRREVIANAIRTFCRSLGAGSVQMSHGVERIYYAGISLEALSVAVDLALGLAAESTVARLTGEKDG